MVYVYPADEPDPGEWEERPEETEYCEIGIAPGCTDEAGYVWNDQYCCAHCFSFLERQQEQPEPLPEQQVRR